MAKKQAHRRERSSVQLVDLLSNLTAAELQAHITGEPVRSQRIEMRVTSAEKELILRLAKRCGVSVTEVLVALAELATARLPSSSR